MSTPRRLRVIGPKKNYRFFLPPDGEFFQSSDFFFVAPGQALGKVSKLSDSDSLTVVISPDCYDVNELRTIMGRALFWYLEPVFKGNPSEWLEAPRLGAAASEILEKRCQHLSQLGPRDSSVVVVSDQDSFEYCSNTGHSVMISPPPVSDSLADQVLSSRATIAVWVPSPASNYVKEFLAQLPAGTNQLEALAKTEAGFLKVPSHWVVPRSTLLHSFPYEAAMALVAGQTLISETLRPRWGLEPGLDYIEFSTPEELGRIVQHISRYPEATRLLSWRGKSKSSLFSASEVYRRLLRTGNFGN